VSDFKVKFLVLIHQVLSKRKSLWYSRKSLETSEDLEDDLKKGQQKFKTIIIRCFEDSVENKFMFSKFHLRR
jgi:hypothetical protein